MVSGEMLKKLLDEFVEKEALIKEEIQVVTDEITRLEVRLEGCRERLSTLSVDRQKVLAMKERYLNGNFSAPTSFPQPAVQQKHEVVSPPSAPTKVVMEVPNNQAATRARSGLAAILGGRSRQVEESPAVLPPAEEPSKKQQAAQAAMQPLVQEPAATFQQVAPAPPPQPVIEPEPAAKPDSPWGGSEQSREEQQDYHWQAAAGQDPQRGDGVVELESAGEENEDDTVKSINDALRSLFR